MKGTDIQEFEESNCWELALEFIKINWEEIIKVFKDKYFAFVEMKYNDACSAQEDRER